MTYTVFIYKDDLPLSQEGFSDVQQAFAYLGELDLKTDVQRCILDNGIRILFDLTRDENGDLTST